MIIKLFPAGGIVSSGRLSRMGVGGVGSEKEPRGTRGRQSKRAPSVKHFDKLLLTPRAALCVTADLPRQQSGDPLPENYLYVPLSAIFPERIKSVGSCPAVLRQPLGLVYLLDLLNFFCSLCRRLLKSYGSFCWQNPWFSKLTSGIRASNVRDKEDIPISHLE